jgi:hypothetical protein
MRGWGSGGSAIEILGRQLFYISSRWLMLLGQALYLLACVLLTRNPAYEIQLANTFITHELNSLVTQLFNHPSMAEAARCGWANRCG